MLLFFHKTVSQPLIEVTPDTIDTYASYFGYDYSIILQIANAGDEELEIFEVSTDVEILGEFWSEGRTIIAQHEEIQQTIHIQLPEPGLYEGVITITSNSQRNEVLDIPVSLRFPDRQGVDLSGDGVTIHQTVYLSAGYPNPFNSRVKLRYGLPASGWASLRIYDLAGREVAVLVDGEVSAGVHEVAWDASGLATGVYVVRLEQAGNLTAVKLVLTK